MEFLSFFQTCAKLRREFKNGTDFFSEFAKREREKDCACPNGPEFFHREFLQTLTSVKVTASMSSLNFLMSDQMRSNLAQFLPRSSPTPATSDNLKTSRGLIS